MKIVFEKIRFKNFLSFGNNWTEINLNSHKSTSIIGKNGSGKCLRKSSEIEIRFKNEEVEKKFKEFMKNKQ